ncbi:MAG: aldo/keto reductase [Rhodobacteraceae bacterium]|nr:aldo/keto reductase [Paracoccaceae bacterium]
MTGSPEAAPATPPSDAPSVIAPPLAPFPEAWPRLGLGCAGLGDLFALLPEETAAATLAAAWDSGLRYFDTAPWYGHGLSEHRLGTALRGWPRAAVTVSTKVGRVYDPAPRGEDARIQWKGGLNFARRFDYSAEGFEASLAQSRLRLGTPAVEALVIHDLDRGYHGADHDRHMRDLTGSGLAFLHGLRRRGEIAAVGMGMNRLEDFAALAPWIEVDFFLVAMPYTLIDQSALEGPMTDCLRRGIRVVIGAPFASGLLANPSDPGLMYGYGPVPEAIRARALAIEAVCLRHGVPLAAAALQFPLLHPAVVSVIPGAVSPAQLRQNAANAARPIPPELWGDLRRAGLIHPDAPVAPPAA